MNKPFPPKSDPAVRRLAHVRAWLQADDIPAAAFPDDGPITEAWAIARARCYADPVRAVEHLDRFLHEHRDTLADLAWHARFRRVPARLLDDVIATIDAVLPITLSA